MAEQIPRRARMEQWVSAERAIYEACLAVERMPADVRLTEAVIALGKARDLVADYVDERNDHPPIYPDEHGDWAAANSGLSAREMPTKRREINTAEPLTARTFEWATANVYMLARRELRRIDSGRANVDAEGRERWQHVMRICEDAGVKQYGVLRHSVPTELTEG